MHEEATSGGARRTSEAEEREAEDAERALLGGTERLRTTPRARL